MVTKNQTPKAVEVKNLTKKYKQLLAVDNISFEVKKGGIEQFIKRLAVIYDRRYAVLDDDSSLLPATKKALEEKGLPNEIRNKLSSIGFEHSIRRLGDSHVLKIACPETLDVMRSWVEWIKQGHTLSKKYIPAQHFLNEQVVLVPLEGNVATYMIVSDFVRGKSLLSVKDEEIFGDATVAKNLLSFFKGNSQLYKETGLSMDVGSPPSKPFNPRYTDNIFIRESDKQAVVTDSVLLPRNFKRLEMPQRYFFGPAWYFVYDNLTRKAEDRLIGKLNQATRQV